MITGTAGTVTMPGNDTRPALRRRAPELERVPDLEPPYDDAAAGEVTAVRPALVDTTPRELGTGLTVPSPTVARRRQRLRHDAGHGTGHGTVYDAGYDPARNQSADGATTLSTFAREAGRAIDGADGRFRPVPRSAAAVVTRALLEVVCGQRPAAQLAAWTTPQLQAELTRVSGTVSVRRRYVVRSLRVTEPQPGVAEVVAVVARDDRVAAIALRMESSAGRWRVTRFEMG